MSDLSRRLDKLAALYGARDCRSCERWYRTEVVIIAPPTNSAERAVALAPTPSPPVRCLDCGRRPPRMTTLVQIIAPDDADTPDYIAHA